MSIFLGPVMLFLVVFRFFFRVLPIFALYFLLVNGFVFSIFLLLFSVAVLLSAASGRTRDKIKLKLMSFLKF